MDITFFRFARNAENYDLVMTAARHYWNACIPLVNQPIERELLREPIKAILHSITATAEKVKKPEVNKVQDLCVFPEKHDLIQ